MFLRLGTGLTWRVRVKEGYLQAAAGGGGGLQRQGENSCCLQQAYVAGAGQRLHPREFRPDGSLRRLHSRVS